jgi:multimeric flavodoxin WrbA
MKFTAILGTYHKGGIIESAVDRMLEAAAQEGAEVRKIHLLDQRIEFCRNCQMCTLAPGAERGQCPIVDDMGSILEAVEAADVIVLASPMNFGSVTAMMKQFIERLICYGYWPWENPAPRNRIVRRDKRAILVGACAAPALVGRYLTGMHRLLKQAAGLLGAGRIDTLFIGRARHTPTATLSERDRARAARLGRLAAIACRGTGQAVS